MLRIVMSLNDKEATLRQYELLVNSTQNVTTWRQNANTFYLTLSTALISGGSYASFFGSGLAVIASILGIIIAFLWWITIVYYRTLNRAKFDIIHKLENKLPDKVFKEEWETFKKKKVIEATSIEEYLPIIFSIWYIVLIGYYFYPH